MATERLLSMVAENMARVDQQALDGGKASVWSMVAEWPQGHAYDTERATIEVTIKGDAGPILLTPGQILGAISQGAAVFDFRIPLLSAGAFGASAAAVLAIPAPVDEVFCLFARDLRETSTAVALGKEGAFMSGSARAESRANSPS